MRYVSALLGASALFALISGCATPSQPKAMVAVPQGEVHHSTETVAIAVTGGKETSSIATSQISDKDFTQALRESIEKSGLFAKAMDTGSGAYRLDAYIGALAQPFIGFDLTVTMEVGYTLTNTQSQKAVWKKSIRSTYTATTKDSLLAVTRLEMANEGAARQNIQQAIAEMSKLNLE
jgi:hypothetical protein